eukprot:gene2505-3211_t
MKKELKEIEQEYFQKEYMKMIEYKEEKNYVSCLLSGLLIQPKLPYSKQLYSCMGESCEKLGFISSGRRCFVLSIHLRPTDLSLLNKYSNFLESNNPQATQMNELKKRRNLLNEENFDLKFYFFKQLMNEGKFEKAYEFISSYFIRNEIENSNEVKIINDEFLKNDQIQFAINILVLGTKLYPKEENFYFLLYELFVKIEDFLSAFKSYVHYIYFSRNLSFDQVLTCANLLEKSKYFWHSFLLYYNYLTQFPNDEKILKKIKELIDQE